MKIRLPIPQNWQDFESICHLLWREIWNDPNTQKNGRSGQSQNGVDIFGTPIYTKKYAGVQCKDKDCSLGSTLKKTDITSECDKSKSFKPELASFTIATTSCRDSSIQEVARNLTEEKKYPFSVQVWSWDDIQDEIQCRPIIFQQYYNNLSLSIEEQSNIKMQRYSPRDQIQAYLSRPSVSNKIPEGLKDRLVSLIHELLDNAFRHGKATEFSIKIESNKIIFIDNGIAFNPITELNATLASVSGHMGSYVFEEFKTFYNTSINLSYSAEKKLEKNTNNLILAFKEDLFTEMEESIEIIFDTNNSMSRQAAQEKASSLNISDKVKNVTIIITNDTVMSFSMAYFDNLLKRLKPYQTLTISVPRNFRYDFATFFNDPRVTISQR